MSVVHGVVDDEDLDPALAGEHFHEADDRLREAQKEGPPVVARVSEQVVCGVLFEVQGVVFDDAAIEVCAYEGEEEDGGEQGLWGSAAQFF